MRRFYSSRKRLALRGFLYFVVFLITLADVSPYCQAAIGDSQSYQPDLPLETVVTRWGLTSTESTRYGPIELSGRGTRLSVAPGLRFAIVNHHTISLSKAPAYKDGSLILPGELLRFLPAPLSQSKQIESDLVIIIDPGHGGKDPGAIGYKRIKEKDVTLKVGLYVREYLSQRGIKVKMTRENDTYPTLEARSDMANRTPKSVFISIHANAARQSNAEGVETFVLANRISDTYRSRKAAANYSPAHLQKGKYSRRKNEAVMRTVCKEARVESLELANEIHQKLIRTTGETDRGVKKDNLHVLRESYFSPAILVELGFLTHPPSARMLARDEYQRQLAKSIADGIVDFLIKRRNTKPRTAWDTLLSSKRFQRWN